MESNYKESARVPNKHRLQIKTQPGCQNIKQKPKLTVCENTTRQVFKKPTSHKFLLKSYLIRMLSVSGDIAICVPQELFLTKNGGWGKNNYCVHMAI